jgi:RNA polymerase sigma-70 factor (ECF subfamily)
VTRVQPVESGAALVDADANPAPPDAAAEAAPPSRAGGDAPKNLIDRLRDGAPGSFEEVVAAYQARLTRLAYRLLGWQTPDVEDVVQEVFLSALVHRSRFRGEASLVTWLTAITVNRCRSAQRRRKLRSLLFGRERGADEVAADVPAWTRSVARETSSRVREAVQSLPPRDREVIVLRYFEQLTASEIAGVTRQSTNAVDVRLHRARAKLAATLGEWHREAQ